MSNKEGQVIVKKLTAKDFQSSQQVKWCPGCGDYSVLAQVTRVMPELNIPKENFVFVSGIGCSSRFPYYVNTYGFHGIHGRAPAIATGIKVSNPELSVWVATGDGDLLSIGGNHFIHTCRRNVDLKILLFNNRIYGLTKGQYSPTSERGKKTKTSPYGVIDYPFDPVSVALGSGATFVARSIDRNPKHLQEMMKKAANHKGTAFIEIYQNCSIFNNGAYDRLTDKDTKDDSVIVLEEGKPLVFGKDRSKGIKLDGFKPVIVDLNDGVHSENDLWVHEEHDENPGRAAILSKFVEYPEFPTPIGLFWQETKPTYDQQVEEQIAEVKKLEKADSLEDLIAEGGTWQIS